jgi:hypothetical protein
MVAVKEPMLKALVLLAGQGRSLGGAAKFQLENMAKRNTALTPAQRDSASRTFRVDGLDRLGRSLHEVHVFYVPSRTRRR